MTSPSTKIVLITGGNQGIGYLTAQLLAQSQKANYHILLTSRTLSKVQDAVQSLSKHTGCRADQFTPIEMDVASPRSITAAYDQIAQSHKHIDILINNAGIVDRSPDIFQEFTSTLTTNVTGAATVSATFLPLLKQSTEPRIVHVSSGLGSLSLAENKENVYYPIDATAYRCSKAALNMLTVQQHKLLGKDGVKVIAVCPGHRATNLSGDVKAAEAMGATDPVMGAEVIRGAVEGERDGDIGKMVKENGEVWAW